MDINECIEKRFLEKIKPAIDLVEKVMAYEELVQHSGIDIDKALFRMYGDCVRVVSNNKISIDNNSIAAIRMIDSLVNIKENIVYNGFKKQFDDLK